MALALAEPEPLGPADTVLSVGSYGAGDFAIIAAMKRRHGFRYVGMCHDLIAPGRRERFGHFGFSTGMHRSGPRWRIEDLRKYGRRP